MFKLLGIFPWGLQDSGRNWNIHKSSPPSATNWLHRNPSGFHGTARAGCSQCVHGNTSVALFDQTPQWVSDVNVHSMCVREIVVFLALKYHHLWNKIKLARRRCLYTIKRYIWFSIIWTFFLFHPVTALFGNLNIPTRSLVSSCSLTSSRH